MKLILISDLHLLNVKPIARIDNLIKTQFDKFDFVLEYASKNNCTILQAGDFFDKPRSWYLLPKVIEILKQYSVPIFSVVGQHDQYMYSKEYLSATSIGVLEKAKLITLLSSKPIYITDDVDLYGCNYGEEIPKVIDKKNKNILVIHAPIAEKSLFINQDYIKAKTFINENKDYKIIFCGDIHRSFCLGAPGGRTILNTGPMIRKTADKYNFSHKPYFYVYDTDTDKIRAIDIPHRPGKEVLSNEHILDEEDKKVLRNKFTESLSKEIEVDMSFTSNLEAFLRRNRIVRKGVRNVIAKELSVLDVKDWKIGEVI